MRIIGQINHPSLKISVFKNEQRVSVKFENPFYEITWKLGSDERFQSLETIEQLLDETALQEVQLQLQQLHATRLAALARCFPATGEQEFDVII
jgi:hypothetical protein